MLVRIVKMEFQPENVDAFLRFFDQVKSDIATFPGCYGMKLLVNKENSSIIFTYSHWENQDALNKYRKSELFGSVWPIVKPWFHSKPEAWSLDTYFEQFH